MRREQAVFPTALRIVCSVDIEKTPTTCSLLERRKLLDLVAAPLIAGNRNSFRTDMPAFLSRQPDVSPGRRSPVLLVWQTHPWLTFGDAV
jgi:hypothetical protein